MSKTLIMINKIGGSEVKVPEANFETMQNRGYFIKDEVIEIKTDLNEDNETVEGSENGKS